MNPENRNQKNESAVSGDLPCSVVRDLLPLYVDGAVSSETREMIRIHLDGCPECRMRLESLKKELDELVKRSAGPASEDVQSSEFRDNGDPGPVPSFRKLHRTLVLRRIFAAVLAAVLCLGGFGLWYHWYHYSESYISLEESGLQADGEKLVAAHTIPGRLIIGISPDESAIYLCAVQTPETRNSQQILQSRSYILSLAAESFGEELESGADQMEIPDTVKSAYYLSEQGWELYREDALSLDKDSSEAREVSEKIEASSTKLAER